MKIKEFFSLSGRINRIQYLVNYGLMVVLFGVVYGLWLVFGQFFDAFVKDMPMFAYVTAGLVIGIPALVGTVALLFWPIKVHVKRLHDFDFSGWWSLLFLVPVVATLGLVLMCCFPGTKGDNRFGPAPAKANLRQKIFAGFGAIIMLAGILFSLVSLVTMMFVPGFFDSYLKLFTMNR